MSFDFRSLSAVLLCFLVAMVAGCDSETEKVAEADPVKTVEDEEVLDGGSGGRSLKDIMPRSSQSEPDGPAVSEEYGKDRILKNPPPPTEVTGETEKKVQQISSFKVAVGEGGGLTFQAPSIWEQARPRSNMVEYEISVPKSNGDDKNGRLTIMGAGGSVEANINRWYGQYSQPNGSDTKDVSKVTESMVGKSKVIWVDIKGTLLDRAGGPMAGGEVVERENYRMLAAIVQTGEHGQYFIKLYGPSMTVTKNEAAFRGFVESLKVDDDSKGL